jgi:hypothetical protein
MKTLFKASLLAMGLSISAFAADSVPTDSKGNSSQPQYAGSKTCIIDVSTGTNSVLCATGVGVILQVIPSSTTTDIIVFRDSATANTSSTKLAVLGGAAVAGTYVYPRFNNGLSANLLTVGGTWTVIYAQNLK